MHKGKQKNQISMDSDEQSENAQHRRVPPLTRNDNFTQQRDGQTLFDFIKRRKKYAIIQEITKKKKSPKKKMQKHECQFDIQQTDRTISKTPCKRNNSLFKSPDVSSIQFKEQYRTPRPSISPFKKVTFADTTKRSNRGSTSMRKDLSPSFIKQLDETVQTKQNPLIVNRMNSSYKKSDQKNLLNDKILSRIEDIDNQLEILSRNSQSYRSKSYALLIGALELIDQLAEQNQNCSSYQKKISEMKISKKILDKQYQEIQSLLSSISIRQITRVIKERFCTIEVTLQQKYEEILTLERKKFFDYYEEQLKVKDKQFQKLNRQYERLELKIARQKEKQIETIAQNQKQKEKRTKEMRDKANDWKEHQTRILSENTSLNQELCELNQKVKLLQNQKKTIEHEKNSLMKCFEQEKSQVQTAKQKILLQGITNIKKKYQTQLVELQEFNKVKQQRYIDELDRLESMLKDHLQRQKLYEKFESSNSNQLQILKTQMRRLKSDNDKLSAVILTLEKESCYYWGALKDVKVLSSRLGIFSKFSRIYDDIQFSDVALR